MTNNTHTFKNTEVNNILEWWLMNYGFELIDKEDGLYLDDLQDETLSKYTTEEEVINYFIGQIEAKIEDGETDTFIEELQVLKNYIENWIEAVK